MRGVPGPRSDKQAVVRSAAGDGRGSAVVWPTSPAWGRGPCTVEFASNDIAELALRKLKPILLRLSSPPPHSHTLPNASTPPIPFHPRLLLNHLDAPIRPYRHVSESRSRRPRPRRQSPRSQRPPDRRFPHPRCSTRHSLAQHPAAVPRER